MRATTAPASARCRWVWADALLYSIAVGGASFSPVTLVPGLVATAAVVLMNFVSREEVMADYLDEAATVRGEAVTGRTA